MSSSNLTAAIRKQLMKDAVHINSGSGNFTSSSPLENPTTTITASFKQPKEKTLQCTHCPKLFSSAPALSRHRREQHKLQPKKIYVCPLCKTPARNKAFYREHLLSVHQTTLEDEKLNFDSYLDFTHWKEAIEASTKSYFIRSRIVNTENRYDEYYGCHRSGSRPSKACSDLDLKETSKNRRKNSLSTSEGCLKIGGLCPASIKLHYSKARANRHFEVHYCSTHIGHLRDTELVGRRLSSSRKSKASTKSNPSKQRKESKGGVQSCPEMEKGSAIKYTSDEAATSLAIDSIILTCAYGCPELPVCEHLKPFQVAEDNGQINHQNAYPVDHHYYQALPTASSANSHQPLLPQPHPSHGPSAANSTQEGQEVQEEKEEEVIVEEGIVDLTDMATIETLFGNSSSAEVQLTSTSNQETPITQSSVASIKIADLLQQPALTLLFSSLLQRTNSRNVDYVQRKLQQILGTLDSLELIHGSYSRPPEEENNK